MVFHQSRYHCGCYGWTSLRIKKLFLQASAGKANGHLNCLTVFYVEQILRVFVQRDFLVP